MKRHKSKFNEGKNVDWSTLGEVSYYEAINMIENNWRDLEEAMDVNEDLGFGSGRFEKWYDEQDTKITLSDIKKLSSDASLSLLSNIFYNGVSMSYCLSSKVLMALIERVVENDISYGDGVEEAIGDNIRSYKGPRKKEAQYAISLLDSI